MVIPADDEVGMTIQLAGEECVVVGIVGNGVDVTRHCDELGVGTKVMFEDPRDIGRRELEFRVREHSEVFIEDFIGQEQATASVLPHVYERV